MRLLRSPQQRKTDLLACLCHARSPALHASAPSEDATKHSQSADGAKREASTVRCRAEMLICIWKSPEGKGAKTADLRRLLRKRLLTPPIRKGTLRSQRRY